MSAARQDYEICRNIHTVIYKNSASFWQESRHKLIIFCKHKLEASSVWLQERTQGAFPPDSYTPIGQAAPLSPRPPRPKPLLSLTLDPTHPGPRERKGRRTRSVTQPGVVLHNV